MRGARSRASVCGALFAAIFTSACGGSAYTKSDFVARADAICTTALRATRSIAPPSGAQATANQPGGLAAYLSSVVPVLENEAGQLRALRRPPGSAEEQAVLSRYFAALAQTVSDYEQLAAAAKRGDDQAATGAEAALGASPVYSLAATYGLHSCGTPGATAA